MRAARWCIGVVMVSGATGCGILGPDGVQGELESNRSLWEASEPDAYRYAVRRLCFCLPSVTAAVLVEVVDGSVVRRTYQETGEPVPAEFQDLFPDVDGLFEVLEDAIVRDAHDISVTWDSLTGVPTLISIDYDEMVADEELGFTVVDLPEVLPGS